LKDRRFSPIQIEELEHLKCSISLLVHFEDAMNAYDWIIGKHGIRINFSHPKHKKRFSATYLPSVCKEQGWNKEECLLSLIEKSGYEEDVDDALIDSIQLTRYQSSISELTFQEYCKIKVK
jgi:AMME syndrome candidate gene 1 protein